MGRATRPNTVATGLLSLALGCSHGSPPKTETAPPIVPASRPAPAPSPAALGRDATFADLVRVAGELEGRPHTAQGCLLAVQPHGFALRGELSSGVRPLPLPPAELDEALKAAASVDVLSAWGRYGDGTGTLALAAFTDTAPTRAASALVLTDHGVRVRPASGGPGAGFDARDLAAALAQLTANGERTWFLTAEAAVPIAQVADALAALGQRDFKVALAVALAPGTPLPKSAAAQVERCPDGLPATDAPEGGLSSAQLAAAVAPLRTAGEACLGQGDARGAAGGRIALMLRVDASGRVQAACATRDELGDPAVLACVLDLARRLSFAPPSPSGVIDLGLPVVLLPGSRPVQRPLCSDS